MNNVRSVDGARTVLHYKLMDELYYLRTEELEVHVEWLADGRIDSILLVSAAGDKRKYSRHDHDVYVMALIAAAEDFTRAQARIPADMEECGRTQARLEYAAELFCHQNEKPPKEE